MLRQNNTKLEDESELRIKAKEFAEESFYNKQDIINILHSFNNTLDEEQYSDEQLEEFLNKQLKQLDYVENL